MSNIPIDALEDCASQVVNLIEECVSVVKANSAVAPLEVSRKKQQLLIDPVNLFACLNDQYIDTRVVDAIYTVDLVLGATATTKNDRQGSASNNARCRVVQTCK